MKELVTESKFPLNEKLTLALHGVYQINQLLEKLKKVQCTKCTKSTKSSFEKLDKNYHKKDRVLHICAARNDISAQNNYICSQKLHVRTTPGK